MKTKPRNRLVLAMRLHAKSTKMRDRRNRRAKDARRQREEWS